MCHPLTCIGSGSDLAPFSSEFFDLVYSFAVFQHIPSTAVVTRYLEESARVLKPGGVLCCQLRGAASPASTTAGESETWVGCVYPASDAIALCRRIGLNLLQITGASTQYMWVVARKPLHVRAPLISVDDAVLKALTPTDNPYGVISPTGLGALFTVGLKDFPNSPRSTTSRSRSAVRRRIAATSAIIWVAAVSN
jgi:SAM-dependent methyltransferase